MTLNGENSVPWVQRARKRRLLWVIVFAIATYAAAALSEDQLIRTRAASTWYDYMIRGVGAFYDSGKEHEIPDVSPSIFVRINPQGQFILNRSWTVEGGMVSSVALPTARLELYEQKIFKCTPGLMECIPGRTLYGFWLLKRVPGKQPAVVRKWLNLQKNLIGYDPAHGRYVPDVTGTITYEQSTQQVHVSIDNVEQPITDTFLLNS